MSANQAANIVHERKLETAGQTVLSRTTDLMRALEGLDHKIGILWHFRKFQRKDITYVFLVFLCFSTLRYTLILSKNFLPNFIKKY